MSRPDGPASATAVTMCQSHAGNDALRAHVELGNPHQSVRYAAGVNPLWVQSMETTVTQAKQTDFARYPELSDSEQKVLEEALASIPDDILSTGERAPIESRVRRRMEREGLLSAAGPMGMGEIPAVAYVARAVVCLAASYVPLRSISHNKPASTVAESIAKAMGDCVHGDLDAVTADILASRNQVAGALGALGLAALGDALLGDEAQIDRW